MTMIEKVARAICTAGGGKPDDLQTDYDDLAYPGHREWQLEIPAAMAAIEAMRDPTDGLVKRYAGPRGAAEWGLDKYHGDFVRAAAAAIVDAALAEEG